MATPTFTEIYKKTGTTGTAADYQVVAHVGVGGVPLAVMKGASSSAAGVQGLVPAPASGNQKKYLRGDGTWATPDDNSSYILEQDATNSQYLRFTTINDDIIAGNMNSRLTTLESNVNQLNTLNTRIGTTDISAVGSTVTEAIRNLNSNLNDEESYSFTHSSLGSSILFIKKGNIVTMSYENNITYLESGKYINLGTIPSNFWPKVQVFCYPGPDVHTDVQVSIRTDGVIEVYNYRSTITTSIPARFSTSYLV